MTTGPLVDQRGKEYRAHFVTQAELAVAGAPLDGAEFLASVGQELASWLLGQKRIDLDVTRDGELSGAGWSVSVAHIESGRTVGGLRARLVEDVADRQWITELLASSDGWIDLWVRNTGGQFAKVPNLAKHLLRALPIGDGALAMAPEARIIGADEVGEVVDALFDPRRQGLVFVCGTDDKHDLLAPFTELVPQWTRQIHGLGQAYLLGPEATAAFNAEVGVFGTLPWSIRTYYPSLDRDDLQDSRRHRYLTTASLARLQNWRVAELLGTIARSNAAGRAEPADVVELRREFQRLRTRRLTEAATIEPQTLPSPTPTEPVASTAPEEAPATAPDVGPLIQLVKDVLQIDELTRESLSARLMLERTVSAAALSELSQTVNQQQEEIWRLEDETRAAEELIEDAQLDEADLRDQIERLERQEAWLRDRLRQKDDHEAAFAQLETMEGVTATTKPSNVLDVVARIDAGKLPGVVFTGDVDLVTAVQERDTVGTAAKAAWDACCALADYVRVMSDGTFEGSVDHYLKHAPEGCRVVPTRKHAFGETEVTMNQYGADRIFPVPTSVDPSGTATMTAHFKLAVIGRFTPRLYYLDRVRQDGKVYIGYIGRHLRNTQTN